MRAAKGGGDANDQALAYFLPGILYNAGYAVVLSLTNIIRWPLVGFMVGSVTGEPTEWRQDQQLVRLCQRLTWLLVAPCLIRVVVQARSEEHTSDLQSLMRISYAVLCLQRTKRDEPAV